MLIFMERKGETIKLIFPQPQRHTIRIYHKSPRRTYQVMEPVYTPPLAIQVGKGTAVALFHEAQAVNGISDFQGSNNNDWWMAIRGIGVLDDGRSNNGRTWR